MTREGSRQDVHVVGVGQVQRAFIGLPRRLRNVPVRDGLPHLIAADVEPALELRLGLV